LNLELSVFFPFNVFPMQRYQLRLMVNIVNKIKPKIFVLFISLVIIIVQNDFRRKCA